MDELLSILNEIGLPYAYDHFAEGESPNPPFICYLLPGSDNFAADGRVYYKINIVAPHIEVPEPIGLVDTFTPARFGRLTALRFIADPQMNAWQQL